MGDLTPEQLALRLRTAANHALAGRSVGSYISPQEVIALVDALNAERATVADLTRRLEAAEAALAEERAGMAALSQKWCVVYDSDTPFMDGTHPPLRMAEQSLEMAERNLAVVQARSAKAPKRNLRIETRFVTEWTTHTGTTP